MDDIYIYTYIHTYIQINGAFSVAMFLSKNARLHPEKKKCRCSPVPMALHRWPPTPVPGKCRPGGLEKSMAKETQTETIGKCGLNGIYS